MNPKVLYANILPSIFSLKQAPREVDSADSLITIGDHLAGFHSRVGIWAWVSEILGEHYDHYDVLGHNAIGRNGTIYVRNKNFKFASAETTYIIKTRSCTSNEITEHPWFLLFNFQCNALIIPPEQIPNENAINKYYSSNTFHYKSLFYT